MEAVEYLLGDLAALRRHGVVDGSQLLIALPGEVDFVLWVAGCETVADLGLLLLGEVFDAVPEQPADLVERVVFVPASTERVLLHPPSDLVNDLGAEPDNVEGVKDRDRVGQPVMNGVRISTKWVQRSLLHAVDEPVGLGFQPGFVDAPGAADDGIQQPGVQASSLVTGQIHHDGDGSIDPDPRWPPNVLIDSEGLHPLSRSGLLVRALASTSIASQAVCQSTPKCLASAETVVSS